MICVFKRSPEFASSNPRSLSGHGEVASALVGMQASCCPILTSDIFTREGLRPFCSPHRSTLKQRPINYKSNLILK